MESIRISVLTFKPLACINQTTLEYDEPKNFQSRISFLACNIYKNLLLFIIIPHTVTFYSLLHN